MDLSVLRRGVNMDHQFLPYRRARSVPDAGEWAHMEGSLKAEEFAAVAKAGFSHVRLCLGRDFLQSREAPYSFHERGFDLMLKAAGMIREHGLAVILDLHELPAPDFEKEPELRRPFADFWREMGRRCRHLPPEAWYGLLNEPVTSNPALWGEVAAEAVRALRENDAERPVIVAGDGWGNLDALVAMGDLKLSNVAYDFHFYFPMAFTHQGAGWGSDSLGPIRGIAYPMDPPAFRRSWEEFRATGLDDWPFREYEKMPDREGLRRKMAPVVSWAKTTGLPVYCGEFGVRRGGAPVEVRARWTADVRELLEEAGIPWALWSYHSGFDLFDADNVPDPVLLRALGL